MEFFRDQAAEHFERHTGSAWRPRSGSMVNRRTLTAAMVDSRDFIAARRRADAEVMMPAGAKIAFTGGLDFNDHVMIWDRLDKDARQVPGHGAAARRQSRKARSALPSPGPITARCHRSRSNRTGPVTPRRRRLVATTRC